MTVLGCRALRVARWTRPGRHDRCLAGPRAAFVNDKMKFTGKPQQAAAEDPTRATPLSRLQELQGACKSLPVNSVEPKRFVNDMGERIGFICGKDVKEQEVLLVVPEALAITAVDAEKHPVVGRVAQQCSELVGLTLWLMAERALGQDSKHAAFLQTLPDNTLSPILWSDADIASMLRGSPVMQEAKNRKSALKRQWEVLSEQFLSKEPAAFSPAVFNEDSFGQAFSVVLGHSTYLPSAECFALVPLIATMGRTGGDNGCNLDYDASTSSVVLTAGRPYREGQEVLLNDGRPNGELVLATGTLQDNNPSDNLLFNAELLPADRYFMMKSQILDQLGFKPKEAFPVFPDRMPVQLLAYLRLSRVADPALFAKVSFEQDVLLSDINEYEVLQLLMGDCRERLAGYASSTEEDIKSLQSDALTPKQRLALKLVAAEKGILRTTMEAVRRKLAPIRGIPTKTGALQDPNQDLKEIFDLIEDLPNKPKKLIDGFMSWARGDFDPEWQAAKKRKNGGSPGGGGQQQRK